MYIKILKSGWFVDEMLSNGTHNIWTKLKKLMLIKWVLYKTCQQKCENTCCIKMNKTDAVAETVHKWTQMNNNDDESLFIISLVIITGVY